MTKQAWLAIIVGSAVLVALLARYSSCADDPWPAHEGQLRQTARMSVDGLRRGGPGTVTLAALANYTTRAADVAETTPVPRFVSVTLSLVGKAGATPLPVSKWVTEDGRRTGTITLPEVADGDYLLRADYETSLGRGQLDVPLPLYTPARVHVITDRPLYEPGNTVRFRAVVLRARDLAPLDGRPGRWVIKDPTGEVLLEESSPAGAWGVVAGSFPLDLGAATGSWRVAWTSSDATDEVAFTVEPFTLPRFRVEAAPTAAYYRASEAPVIRGAVRYSSGAPVAGATLAISWRITGSWPPPTTWQATLLPKTGVAGADGRFELGLPRVPDDLQGRVTMTARIAAVDPAGDRVEGTATVLLTEDGLEVSAVTEVGDGLVEGFNNRMYVRVTSPDGRVLPATKINVKRAWQPEDQGIEAETDADGVASLQLDPGPPVNVVIPALPYRPPPRPAAVSRDEAEELIGDQGASLPDQVAIDTWLAALAPCGRWFDESGAVRVGFRVSAGGAVLMAAAGATELDRCTAEVVRRQRLPAGGERLYAITFTFTAPDLPTLEASVEAALDAPEELAALMAGLPGRARDCLPRNLDGALPRALTWSVRAGSKEIALGGWIADPSGGAGTAAAMGCVTSRLAGARLTLDEPAAGDALGLVRFTLGSPDQPSEADRPQPTTMLGYELLVTADVEGQPSTRLRVKPGEIPNLRLRVSPVLARAGETLTAELIRGPSFAGTLPEELTLTHLKGTKQAKLDAKHQARITIDPGTEGWCEITTAGVRALVYVRPDADLTVSIEPGQPRYGPGQQADLKVQTQIAGRGSKAAVGLFGVDESLGQLVTLPDAGELARLRPTVTTTTPAFGVLDGQALTLGRIRGANAAAATVLRVTAIPAPPALDAVVSASAASHFDPLAELTDNFYVVLAELHAQARGWEASAPPGEQMHPTLMAKLWKQAIAACAKRGQPVVDAYGRTLRLSRLPADLLALTDPRAVVVVGTRLPEDVENWSAWVQKEKP